ncbi:MAG: hypothetical protein WC773_01525 [Patescibacteria group bacterium]|jgi:hypothetical protein
MYPLVVALLMATGQIVVPSAKASGGGLPTGFWTCVPSGLVITSQSKEFADVWVSGNTLYAEGYFPNLSSAVATARSTTTWYWIGTGTPMPLHVTASGRCSGNIQADDGFASSGCMGAGVALAAGYTTPAVHSYLDGSTADVYIYTSGTVVTFTMQVNVRGNSHAEASAGM